MKGIKIGVLFFLAIGVGTAFYTNQQGQINQYLESAKTATKAVNFIDKVTNIEQTMNQSTASRKVASEANSKASQAVVEAANKAAKRGANLERCVAGRTRGHKLYGYGLGLVPGATGGVSAAMACDKLIARDKAKKEAKEIAEIKAAIESGFLTHPEVKALNELRVIEFEAALMGPLWFKSKEKRIHELERQLGPHIFKDHDGTKKLEKYEMGDRTRYEKIYNLIKREYEINNLILAQFSKEKKKELCEEWIKVAQVSVNNKSRLHKFAGYYAKRKGDFSEKGWVAYKKIQKPLIRLFEVVTELNYAIYGAKALEVINFNIANECGSSDYSLDISDRFFTMRDSFYNISQGRFLSLEQRGGVEYLRQ